MDDSVHLIDGDGERTVENSMKEEEKNRVQYIMVQNQRKMKILGEENGLSVEEFVRQLRAEWIRNNCSVLDRIDMILNFLSTSLKRELKLQNECTNPDSLLDTLDKILNEEHKLPELMMKFYTMTRREEESIYDFSCRLYDLYDIISSIRKKQGKSALEDDALRNQFIAQLKEGLTQKMLREQ